MRQGRADAGEVHRQETRGRSADITRPGADTRGSPGEPAYAGTDQTEPKPSGVRTPVVYVSDELTQVGLGHYR
jgi:hypothetical protein